MIWFYSGTNGSGKSMHTAKDIYDRMRRKNHNGVIATFDIAVDKIKNCKGKFTSINIYSLTPQMLIDYALDNHVLDGTPEEVEGQTLVVIDEAQRIFNPRDYSAKDRRAWLDWFPEHRKWGYTFILISPYDKMIDKQIRALFEFEVKHRKANNFGAIGFFFTLLHVKLFFAIIYWYGVKEKTGVEHFTVKKKYSSIYNTFQRFERKQLNGVASQASASDGGAEPAQAWGDPPQLPNV